SYSFLAIFGNFGDSGNLPDPRSSPLIRGKILHFQPAITPAQSSGSHPEILDRIGLHPAWVQRGSKSNRLRDLQRLFPATSWPCLCRPGRQTAFQNTLAVC